MVLCQMIDHKSVLKFVICSEVKQLAVFFVMKLLKFLRVHFLNDCFCRTDPDGFW